MGPHINKEEKDTRPQVKFEAADHGDSVLAGLKHLREKEQLFDVFLVAQGRRFPAHRVVLASCCDYFRAMFTDGLAETHQTEIHLNGVTAKGMKNLIDFAYSSKVFLDFDNIEDVLLSANHIQMSAVIQACIDFLKDHLCVENCSNVANWAEMFSLKKLKSYTFRFMCANFSSLAVSAEFRRLPLRQFQTLLSCNYPVDCPEVEILSSIVNWVAFNLEERQHLALHLFQNIHFETINMNDVQKLPNVTTLYKILENVTELKTVFSPQAQIRENRTGILNSRGYQAAIVCAGGFSPHGGMKNDLLCYIPGSSNWSYLTKIPHVKQCNFGHAVLNNELYVIGGCFNDYLQEVVHRYGFKYNPQSQSWCNISQMPSERCRFYLGALNGKLYAIGGEPSSTNPDTQSQGPCEKYDPTTNTWSSIQPIPLNCSQHAGVTKGDCIYVSGGFQEVDYGAFMDFQKYDTVTDQWTQLARMQEYRADHAMFVYEGYIHVIGGWYDADLSPDSRVLVTAIDRYIEEENRWETVGQVEEPRLYSTYTLMENKLFVTGGWIGGDYHKKAKTIQVYNLATKQWSNISDVPLEVWEHSTCAMYLPVYEDIE